MSGGIKPLLSFTWRLVWFKEICMSVNLTGGGLVMVNFMCQLDWATRVPR